MVKRDLELVERCPKVLMVLCQGRREVYNYLYIFRSKTREVRLDMENSRFRWAAPSEIIGGKNYTNMFR